MLCVFLCSCGVTEMTFIPRLLIFLKPVGCAGHILLLILSLPNYMAKFKFKGLLNDDMARI